jgi:hypothetical protein
MEKFLTQLLMGNDRRRLNNLKIVLESVTDQKHFDGLFALIFHHERTLVMRAADAVEKITVKKPQYLKPHKLQLLSMLKNADHIELRWHLAQLVSRLDLSSSELSDTIHILQYWVLNRNESKIVRVNALQAVFDISRKHPEFTAAFERIANSIKSEPIPSLQARLRKLNQLRH